MFGFIPATVDDNTTIFYGNNIGAIADATTTLWQTWSKPAGIKFVKIMAIGAGGGGGGGAVISGTTSAGGGGGGSSGTISIVTIPAVFLPDTLYVFVAPRRPGLISTDVVGTNYTSTIVATGPSGYTQVSPGTRFRICIANSGNYGGSTTTATGGSAGVAPAVVSISDMPLAVAGMYEIYDGRSGVLGATGVATPSPGGSTAVLSTTILSGGSGGGAKGTSAGLGGDQVGAGILPSILGGNATTNIGSSGIWNWKPLCGTGGAGGYGSTTVGAAGGDGAFGCGGGGSGAHGTVAQRGGAGGSGLVIISCW